MLHWGLTAAALLLFVYAVRTLFISSKGEGNSGKQTLGGGFAIVAIGLWVYVLNHYLGNVSWAVRLGLGVLLILPSVRAIARPQGARILGAAAGLVLAVIIAGPVVKKLWAEHGPDLRGGEERELADRIGEIEGLRGEYVERLAGLETLRSKLKGEIQAKGSRWEEVATDPELLRQMEVLQRIDEEIAVSQSALAKIDARLPELRAALETMDREGTEVPTDGRSELDDLLLEMKGAPPIDELPVVEQHLKKKELEELFEREF